MILGIDAISLKTGGGLKNLHELINSGVVPNDYGIDQIVLFGGDQLNRLEERPWLRKCTAPKLSNALHEYLWRINIFPRLVSSSCNVLFAPSTRRTATNVPYFCMPQNMLPFESQESARFAWSIDRLRYFFLKVAQTAALKGAAANVFLTAYSKKVIEESVPQLNGRLSAIIPLGSSSEFLCEPRSQLGHESFSSTKPFKLLYVSIINFYKHQWNIVKAIRNLREIGLPLHLTLIGPAHPRALPLLMRELDGARDFVDYCGSIPNSELKERYRDADAFVFGSTCETMPNILLEAMGMGLPIVSSSYGPMPEILGTAGLYFDPLNINSCSEAIARMFLDTQLRADSAERSFLASKNFTWAEHSRRIYAFARQIFESRGSTLQNAIRLEAG